VVALGFRVGGKEVKKMRKIIIFGLMLLCWLGIGMAPCLAAPAQVEQIKVSLGNSAGELKFFPDRLALKTGKQYKLMLDNPSPTKHYFTSKDFADASWTKKVQAGKVEVKGAIHELELQPSAEAEWVITPMRSGTYQLYCSIPGHAEAGMKGKIVVSD
jgi:uncharacterized cupredoxin-like copper-binding protein